MKVSSIGTLATLLAAQEVSATWFTSREDCFPKPSSCDNKCTDQQQYGWSWDSFTPGMPISSFDGYDFSGFTCSDKKGSLFKRGSDKCISGEISKFGHKSSGSAPRIGCGANKDAFSITSFSVYTDEETDVQFTYDMPDGSNCHHTTRCSPEGTEVSNDQCGGATSVSWSIPDHSDVDSCGFGIYSIGFDCSPGEGSHKHTSVPGHHHSYTLPPWSLTWPGHKHTTIPGVSVPSDTQSVSIPTGSVSVPGVSVPSNTPTVPPVSVPGPTGSVSVPGPANTGPTGPVPGVSSTAVVPPNPSVTSQSWTTSTVWTTSLVTITSCAPTITNCPANSQSVITKTIAVSTTICPVTATETGVAVPSGGSPPAPVSSVLPVQSSTPGSTPGSIPGGESCPSVVPKCINTWLPDTCNDNTHASCYCPSSNATSSIISCIQSWGGDASEISAALSYFTGICGDYIPGNPGIITNVPTTIPITPPAAASTGTQAAVSVPCTTITYSSTTITVPQIPFSPTSAPAPTAPAGGNSPPAANPPPAGVSTLATTVQPAGAANPTNGLPLPSQTSSTGVPFVNGALSGLASSGQGALLGGVMALLALFI